MSERDPTESAAPWFPPRQWRQSGGLSGRDGERLQGGSSGCSWPGYAPGPLFVPDVPAEQFKWRVGLDVAHFFPSEISLGVRGGFLEVGGKHEERPDEHGFIARCFTRKYRLPAEIDEAKMAATLSVDGILSVEAPVSRPFVPPAVVIPIQVELEVAAEEPEKAEAAPDVEEDNCGAAEAQCDPPAEGDGGEPPQEAQGDRAEGSEPEAAPAGGAEGTAGVGDHTDAPEPPEHGEPDVGGEIQEMTGLGEAEAEAEAEAPHREEPGPGGSPPSEGPSQETEVAAVKQERTE